MCRTGILLVGRTGTLEGEREKDIEREGGQRKRRTRRLRCDTRLGDKGDK